MTVQTWGVDQAVDKLGDDDRGTIRKDLEAKLAQGKGIAVYENQDLGHRMLGHAIGLTFGTPESQFSPEDFPNGPPTQCPDGLMRDITGGINWRYRLVALVPQREVSDAPAS